MNALWPFGLGRALLAIPVVWLLVALILGVTEKLAAWPPPLARRSVLWITLVVSLIPLALRLIDLVIAWWSGRVGGGVRKNDALAEIHRNRVVYEDMVRRATGAGSTSGATSPAVAAIPVVNARFAQLDIDASNTTDPEMLRALVEEAEVLAQQRAFLCPEKEIPSEAKSHLVELENWGVPAKAIQSLREIAAPALEVPVKDVDLARSALHVIVEAYDYWSPYVDSYNNNSSFWAWMMAALVGVFVPAALLAMFWSETRIMAILFAAIAGAAVSVIAHLPGLTSYGEWKVNIRAYVARLCTGIVGSLVGIGLLGSGWISIPLPDPWKSASSLLNACVAGPKASAVDTAGASTSTPAAGTPAPAPAKCEGSGILFILAATMLLGFSERVLTSLESRVIATGSATSSART